MTTTIGYVTACTGKPKEGYGLWDEVREIENYQDNVDYMVINPQNIFFEGNEFRYKEKKKGDSFPLDKNSNPSRWKWLPASEKDEVDLFDKFSEVDHLRIRGFRSKKSESQAYVTKLALSEMDIGKTNGLDAIDYCNNKIRSIIDISTSDVTIDGKEVNELIPNTRTFGLKDTSDGEKDEVCDYVMNRLRGAHKPQVLKAFNGRGGDDMLPINLGSDYRFQIEKHWDQNDFLVQDKIENGLSLRVEIVGPGCSEDEIYGSYTRRPKDGDFRAQNNKVKEHRELNDFEKNVSLWIHQKSGSRVSAIDYLVDEEDKKDLYFLEINGENPGWKNLKKVYGCDEFLPPGADDGFVDKIQDTGLASYIIDDIKNREETDM